MLGKRKKCCSGSRGIYGETDLSGTVVNSDTGNFVNLNVSGVETCDTINEYTSGSGVTIEGVALVGGGVTATGSLEAASLVLSGDLVSLGGPNVLIGDGAGGISITSAENDVCIGLNAGAALVSASNNILIGRHAGYAMDVTGTFRNAQNVIIGDDIAPIANGTTDIQNHGNTLVGGRYLATSLTTGSSNTFIGDAVGGTPSTGSENTFLGSSSDGVNGDGQIAIGYGVTSTAANTATIGGTAMTDISSEGTACDLGRINAYRDVYLTGSIDTGTEVEIGSGASTSLGGIAIGQDAGSLGTYVSLTSDDNVAIGTSAMEGKAATTIGGANVAVGYKALQVLESGAVNVAVGASAGKNLSTGSANVYVGELAGLNALTAYRCTAIGTSAGYDQKNSSYNTFIGYNSGDAIDTGTYITCLGQGTSASSGGLTNSTAVGSNAFITDSNQIALGNTSIASVVPGNDSTSGSNGCYLGTSGLRWRTLYAYNPSVFGSDRRFKEEITDTDLGLAFINLVRPRKYKMKGEEGFHYGIVAQELREITPLDFAALVEEKTKIFGDVEEEEEFDEEFIEEHKGKNRKATRKAKRTVTKRKQTGSDVFRGIRYAEFISPLIKAVQELTAQNILLSERIAALESM